MDNTHIIETALLLLLAFLIGCAIGWFIRTRFFGAPGIGAAAAPESAPEPASAESPAPAPAPAAETPPAPAASAAPKTQAKSSSSAKKPAAKRTATRKPAAASAPAAEEGRPEALSAPRGGQKDDLKKISGVGPKLEGKLNDLGVYHFDQIAAWDKKTIAWVDTHLSFRGRIERDNWVKQAKAFAKE